MRTSVALCWCLLFAGWTNYLAVSAGKSPELLRGRAKEKAHGSLCARPGYIFLECLEPDIPPPSTAKRVLYTFTDMADVDRTQYKCDDWDKPPGICAAFTTRGALYTTNESTGRIGAFRRFPDCDHRYSDYNMPCLGTYVFDGRMMLRQASSAAAVEQGIADADVAAAVAGGTKVSVRDGDGVTSVVAQLRATYVRGDSAGGPGRIGKDQCSLC